MPTAEDQVLLNGLEQRCLQSTRRHAPIAARSLSTLQRGLSTQNSGTRTCVTKATPRSGLRYFASAADLDSLPISKTCCFRRCGAVDHAAGREFRARRSCPFSQHKHLAKKANLGSDQVQDSSIMQGPVVHSDNLALCTGSFCLRLVFSTTFCSQSDLRLVPTRTATLAARCLQ